MAICNVSCLPPSSSSPCFLRSCTFGAAIVSLRLFKWPTLSGGTGHFCLPRDFWHISNDDGRFFFLLSTVRNDRRVYLNISHANYWHMLREHIEIWLFVHKNCWARLNHGIRQTRHLSSRFGLLRVGLCIWSAVFWKYLRPEEIHPVFLRHGMQLLIKHLENRSGTMFITPSFKNKSLKTERFTTDTR